MVNVEELESRVYTGIDGLKYVVDQSVYAGIYGTGAMTALNQGILTLQDGSTINFFENNPANVRIYNGVTSIGDNAFRNVTSLAYVTIPASVTAIGQSAFSGSGLIGPLMIPSTVTSVGVAAFANCTRLKNVVIEEGLTQISIEMFNGCTSLETIILPSTITSIGYNAFRGCTNLKEINIPDAVTAIGYNAFEQCEALTEITFPSALVNIPAYVCYRCSNLESVTMSDSVTSMGIGAFQYSGLRSVTIPSSLTIIPTYAFDSSKLEEIIIPDNIEEIRYRAFYRVTTATAVYVGAGLTQIGAEAFLGCSNLKKVYNNSNLVITKGSTDNGYIAYYADNIWAKFIRDNLVYLEKYADEEAYVIGIVPPGTMSTVSIPSTVINDSGRECRVIGIDDARALSMTRLEIGENVENIKTGAFSGCVLLRDVISDSENLKLYGNMLSTCIGIRTIDVPQDGLQTVEDSSNMQFLRSKDTNKIDLVFRRGA